MILKYFLLLIAVLNLSLGLIVLRADYKKKVNQSFALLCSLLSIWVFSNFWLQVAPSVQILKFIYALGPFLVSTGMLWTYFIQNDRLDKYFTTYFASIFLTNFFFLAAIMLTPFLISNFGDAFNYTNGPLFSLYSVYIGLLFAIFTIFIIITYKKSSHQTQNQLKFIIVGLITMIVVAATVSFVLPTLGYSKLNFLDSPSSFIFLLFSTQAILKYNIFNVKIISTELFLVVLWLFQLIKILTERASSGERIIDIIVLISTIVVGIMIIKSVLQQYRQTEQLKKLTDDLKNMNKKLEELDKMKTEFISVASHELLTPISAIEGYLSMILDEKLVKVEDPKALQYMDSIYKSAKRLARLVTDLLNVSRIEEGRLLVQKSEINALDLINQVIAELKFKAEDAKVQIETDFPPDVNVNIYADSDKIKEVIINVTGNAIKYTPGGGKIKIGYFTLSSSEVEKRFEIMEKNIQEHNQGPVDESLQKAVDQRLRQIVGENQFIIYVKDSGIGLKHDDLSRLFKKFSRVGEWSTRQVQGTGLGLYISKALIEMHHGRIWAESEGENKGSEFFFSLPLLVNKNKVEEIDKQVPQAENAKPLAKTKEDGR